MKQDLQPRMRVFAGPNGSGKSTLKTILQPELLCVYINPDEIEKNIKNSGYIDFSSFFIRTKKEEILEHLENSTLLKNKNFTGEISKLDFQDQKLFFSAVQINSYFSSAIADFIRNKLIEI